MKKRFKNRKKLQELATKIGLQDSLQFISKRKPGTDEAYFELVNNFNRFVKGTLALPLEQQNARIQALEAKIQEIEEAK